MVDSNIAAANTRNTEEGMVRAVPINSSGQSLPNLCLRGAGVDSPCSAYEPPR